MKKVIILAISAWLSVTSSNSQLYDASVDSSTDSGLFCENRRDGIYADVESQCHKFYVCEKLHQYKFSCPESHRFIQKFETCSYISPEDEGTFNCEDETNNSGLKSQSLQEEEEGNSEGHDIERRIDSHQDKKFQQEKEINRQLDQYLRALIKTSSFVVNERLTHDISESKDIAALPSSSATDDQEKHNTNPAGHQELDVISRITERVKSPCTRRSSSGRWKRHSSCL